ncbi:MAG: flippase [Candidatus Electrothrix sp. ATG2]|nr:flippase [Candidatus Electrothrix sp. ATG2]
MPKHLSVKGNQFMKAGTYKTIFRNTAAMAAGRLISQAAQFFMFIYAARCLGAEHFGIYSFADILVVTLGQVMDMGIYRYSIQQVSRDLKKAPIYLGASLIAKIFLIAIGYILIMGTGMVLEKDMLTMKVLFILATAQALHNLAMPFNSIFSAQEKMQYPAIIISVSNVVMSLIGMGFLYYSKSVLLFCTAIAIGAFLRLGMIAYWCLKKNGKPAFDTDPTFIKHLIKMGIPFSLSTVFITIYNDVDSMMLDVFNGSKVVGYYNAAYRLIDAPLLISESLMVALFPAISRLYKANPKEMKILFGESFYKTFAFGLSVACVIAFLSEDIVLVLYGSEYSPSAHALPVLIFGLAFIMPASICSTTIRSADRQTVGMFVGGGGVILNVVLNLILIPKYSFLGAAWATLITEMIVAGVYLILVQRYVIGSFLRVEYLFRIVMLPILLLIFLYLTEFAGLWFQVAGCIFLFFPFMLLTGVVTIAELKKLFARAQ